jgi:hypothetical protein
MKTVSTIIATILLGMTNLPAEEQQVLIEPMTLKWQKNENPISKTMRVKTIGKNPIRVLKIHSKCERFKYNLEEIDPGREYRVTVTPDETRTPVLGVLRIETDSQNIQESTRRAFMYVKPDNNKN